MSEYLRLRAKRRIMRRAAHRSRRRQYNVLTTLMGLWLMGGGAWAAVTAHNGATVIFGAIVFYIGCRIATDWHKASRWEKGEKP